MLKPLAENDWNFAMAAHLLNRAGFGGTPTEIQKLADVGMDRAISVLLDYENIPDPTQNPDWAKPNPDEIRNYREGIRNAATPDEKRRIQQEQQQTFQRRMMELRGWWMQRMAGGPRPFQEKMVLFWHGHFATSIEKVRNPYYMWRQNELFRRLATANWQYLLSEAGKDPAMLVWLDQAQKMCIRDRHHAQERLEIVSARAEHAGERAVQFRRRLLSREILP